MRSSFNIFRLVVEKAYMVASARIDAAEVIPQESHFVTPKSSLATPSYSLPPVPVRSLEAIKREFIADKLLNAVGCTDLCISSNYVDEKQKQLFAFNLGS